MASNKGSKVVLIFKRGGMWWADYAGTPEQISVERVWGSTRVPLPFAAYVPAQTVSDTFSHLNPGYRAISGLFLRGECSASN